VGIMTKKAHDEPGLPATEGKLRYDESTRRWEIYFHDGDIVPIHAGDSIEVQIASHWIRIRVEHSGKNYIAATPGVVLMTNLPARQIS
jgi:hypothetical protein